MTSAPERYDLMVVEGGKAGKSLAMLRTRTGDKVFVIERDKIGGTCIDVARIPTKTLVSSARRLVEVRTATSYGVDLPEADLVSTRVDLQVLRARKESVVDGVVEAHKRMFAAPGPGFVLGTAKFVGPETVGATLADGSVRVVEGGRVLINAGTTPAVPPIEGLGSVAYWTSEDALRLTEIPDRLVILDGGVIGIEVVSMMVTFGANVTLIEGGEHILAREDADIAEEIATNLTAQSVMVRTDERTMRVSSDGEGVVVHTAAGETAGTCLLVALRHAPVAKNLGLEAAGVELAERGSVKAGSCLETTAPDVYAAGDVAEAPQFTRASWNDFHMLRDLFAGKEASARDHLIPWVVFTTPELGRVGIGESEARAVGRDIRVAKVAAAAVLRVETHDHVKGFYKTVVDVGTEEILGVAIVAENMNEVIATVQTATLGGPP